MPFRSTGRRPRNCWRSLGRFREIFYKRSGSLRRLARPRWQALRNYQGHRGAQTCQSGNRGTEIAERPTDARFLASFSAASRPSRRGHRLSRKEAKPVFSASGERIGHACHAEREVKLTIDKNDIDDICSVSRRPTSRPIRRVFATRIGARKPPRPDGRSPQHEPGAYRQKKKAPETSPSGSPSLMFGSTDRTHFRESQSRVSRIAVPASRFSLPS